MPKESPFSVLIACGGTGGHLFPGIAVAQALRERGVRPLLAISQKEVDRTASSSYPDLEFLALPAKPMPRPYSPAMFPFLAASWKAMGLCRTALRDHRIGAVLGMGGFTSFVPILAAKRAGLPIFLHDSNAVPGKANRMAARLAKTVFLGLAEASTHLGKTRCEVVGTPVRDEFRQPPTRDAALRHFGLDEGKKTLLVLGGSQGARALNRAAVEALSKLDPGQVQAILLTGQTDHQATLDAIASAKLPHRVRALDFCSDMPAACACADLALARSGASTLSELAMVGLPAILVPYPHAADDHQTANALAYSTRKAAVLLPESELDGASLAACFLALAGEQGKLPAMAAAMKGCACPGAAASMAENLLSSLS